MSSSQFRVVCSGPGGCACGLPTRPGCGVSWSAGAGRCWPMLADAYTCGKDRSMARGDDVSVSERFGEGLSARWIRTTPNGGTLETIPTGLRLALPDGALAGIYSDAQIDDYGTLPPSRFPWRPPLHLEVRARASHPAHPAREMPPERLEDQTWLRGTVGFGFWNYPFSLSGAVLRMPEAIWFFAASPPSNMALVPGSVGWGWKAQVVHAHRPGVALAVLPTAAAVAWARLSRRERMAARWVQRLSGTHEAALETDLREWHTYTIDWRHDQARFAVDGVEALSVANPPTRA